MTREEIDALPLRDLLAAMGMSQSACSRRFEIPLRTVQGWVSKSKDSFRECPLYVRLMMAELAGIYKRTEG